MMVIEAGEVCISSISALKKTVTLTVDRCAIFIAALMEIHEEAKELNQKTHPVAYRKHLGDRYYLSVKEGIMCVNFFKYYVPYGMHSSQVHHCRDRITLRLDEWAEMMNIIASAKMLKT